MKNKPELDLISNNKSSKTNYKIDDIVKVQTPALSRENLFIVLSITEIRPNNMYVGEILGIEGFNRGDEGHVFRKLYHHDSYRFEFSKYKTGDKINFHNNNIII